MICDDGHYCLIYYRTGLEYENHVKMFRGDRITDISVFNEGITKEAKKASNTITNYPKQAFKMYGRKYATCGLPSIIALSE